MSFQSKSIREIINGILDGDYVLPAIQRHFVWKHEQIITLFDSIMRGYPIGSFLFWRVKAENLNNYQYYSFIQDFHVNDNKYNKKITPSGTKELTAILDGQQRLTSLLIGLKGSYTYKTPYMQRSNPKAFLKRELYLNLIEVKEDGGYDFAFLTEEEAREAQGKLWYKAGRILTEDPAEYLISDDLVKLPHEKRKLASSLLMNFVKFVDSKIISFYQEEEQDLDKVLNIFIRVNSGGTILSHSDLLLSTATALWKKYDAREEIEKIIQRFASHGNGLKVTSDFVMKACLTLSGLDVRFMVKNFSRTNMGKIENEWEKIRDALLCTMRFVIGYGYTQDNLASYNALLPIAYFIKNKDIANEFDSKAKFKESRQWAITWLRRALLKKAFGGNSDSVITNYRDVISKSKADEFPLAEFEKAFKDIIFSKEDIDELFDETGYSREAFYVLSEIFDMQYNTAIHMDHLYPYSSFTAKNMKKWGFISKEQQEEVLWWADSLANLQLLDQSSNVTKLATPFDEWVAGLNSSEKQKLLLPKMDDYGPQNFVKFCEARAVMMQDTLKKKLGVKDA